MAAHLTDRQRRALTALADTFVATVPREPDPDGYFARCASDLGVAADAEQALLATVPADQLAGLAGLLDALADLGLPDQPLGGREAIVAALAGSAAEVRAGLDGLRGLILMLAYGKPDASGRNPFWRTWGYPGPVSTPPTTPPPAQRAITPIVPTGDLTLDADVVVVGSGSGGGVVAAELARAGRSVVVLEMGGQYTAADFNQYELWAFQHLYLRGGYFQTVDGNVGLIAGSVLGGGTIVNWSNSVRPRPEVRQRWATEHGLTTVDSAEFDGHIDAVLDRISASPACSDFNEPHRRLAEGAEKLGLQVRRAALNLLPERYRADIAGFGGFGDQTGAKQDVASTFLADAVAAGARVLVRTRADRILVEAGRPAGVVADYVDPVGGQSARVTVRAPQVVVSCGSLQTPALLLRSGIGGPAVGLHLHLHPSVVASGVYAGDQRAWWGPPQAAMVADFLVKDGGYGYLLEGVHHSFALGAATTPWRSAAEHKERTAKLGRSAVFVGIVGDRGSGSVTIDAAGEAVHAYPLDDDLDRRHLREALETMIRMHDAAGADEIHVPSPGLDPWLRGDDLAAFVAKVHAEPLGRDGIAVFSAHQMSSARMGTDPATSVAGPTGELHDTPGVWVADASAFPTCSGVNPMVSCMALARRTAGYLAAAVSAPSTQPAGATAR